ncbi:MAG: glycosyltransferase [Clostridia bacterium]|nr:glycosyltransferase [Clostridia bacterium]
MNNVFDFSKQPGKELKRIQFDNKKMEPLITVVIPFYNDKQYIEQAVNSVLNQTFPCFEVLIIDDGSKDEESLKKLQEVSKIDDRIIVFHKENEGLAATRDYGAEKASNSSKYLFFLDSDDLIEPTYFECAYWTLETNQKASWAYTDSVGFEADEYLWNKWFDSEKEKKQNDLVASAMIRKDDFNLVGGYELREKSVNEDWNFWLKMIANGKFPVRMNFYGFWYRRKENGSELAKSKENKKRALEIVNETAKKIKKPVKAIQYPNYSYNWEKPVIEIESVPKIKVKKNSKTNLLMIIPWMIMGGADKFNLDLIKGLDKNKFEVTIISTEPATNQYVQEFSKYATIYELPSFINQKYWTAFINYIIEKNNINIIMNTNSETGYTMLPFIKSSYPNIPIIDYIHMEEWYNRNGGYSRDSSAAASVIDKTLTCNKNSERILEEYFERKKEELGTVYIGVDEDIFNPRNYDKDSEREYFKINKKYVIGYICRITEQKRPFLLLEVIKELKKTRDDFVVLIAGTGNLFHKVKSKAKALGINENIIFAGKVSETQKFYSACDLTFNCSIKEGLALTSYESLAMGVPVISSDVGGQNELINEDVGIIVPCLQKEEDILDFNYSEEEITQYVDGINRIIDNIGDYKSKCRDRVLSGFTISQMVRNMSNLLEETRKNPNKTKIENGKRLSNCTDILSELVVRGFISDEEKYKWECKVYNESFGFEQDDYKMQLFKDKMWERAWYRGLIKLLQKTGIIKVVKKVRGN